MILPRYHIAASTIQGAGKGLFTDEPILPGQVVTAPDGIDQVFSLARILGSPELKTQFSASARWFEDHYTLSPDWPDECYINHSFTPTGLWHLGFVLATAALPAGTEITVDYRHLLPPGQAEDFADTSTGRTITGYSWLDSITDSTRALGELLSLRQRSR
ncbi:MAG: SET domain-containing protein [Rhodanobacter sp.]